MRHIAGRTLWIGNIGDLRDPRALFAAGIEAIVELADNEQLATLPRDLVRLRFPLSDGGENADWLIRFAVNSVAALVEARVPTLICCSCGLNRSVCVAAGGLAIVDGHPFDEVILALAKSGPADISPGLLTQFQAAFQNFKSKPRTHEVSHHRNLL